MSFINERVQPEGLTFDDVLLIPAYSEVLPREVNVQTRFRWPSPWRGKEESA